MPTFNQSKIDKLKKVDNLFYKIYPFPKNKKAYPPIVKEDVKELLIIGFLLIGDTVMYLPALRIIKKNFPNARITLICEKATEIILKEQGIADRFVIIKCPWITPYDTSAKNIFNFISGIKKANNVRYDFAIDFRGDWRNIFYLNFINAKRKASYNFTGGEYMLTDVIKAPVGVDHFAEEAFYFLRQLGCNFSVQDQLPVLTLSATDKVYLDEFKAKNNLNNKLIIGVHPGTSQEVKRWDEHKYSQAIIQLAQKYTDSAFVIYQGPNEQDTVQQIVVELAKYNVQYVIVNKSLTEYILLLSICATVICNDSGAAHIASAFAIPTVVIFGNVDPKYVIPYGAEIRRMVSHEMDCKPCYQSFCKFGTNLCIKSVTVNEVYDSAVDILTHILPHTNAV